jgi:hypothetical protein
MVGTTVKQSVEHVRCSMSSSVRSLPHGAALGDGDAAAAALLAADVDSPPLHRLVVAGQDVDDRPMGLR